MIPGITSGMLKTDLLKAVAQGLDFGVLRLNLAEPGVLQVADNQTLRVQLTVGRFELEGEVQLWCRMILAATILPKSSYR